MKKILAIILAAVLILSMAACAKKEPPKTDDKPDNTASSGNISTNENVTASSGNITPSTNVTASSGNLVVSNDLISFLCGAKWVAFDSSNGAELKLEVNGTANVGYWSIENNKLSLLKSLGNAKFETLAVFNIVEKYGTTILECESSNDKSNTYAASYVRTDAKDEALSQKK